LIDPDHLVFFIEREIGIGDIPVSFKNSLLLPGLQVVGGEVGKFASFVGKVVQILVIQ